MSEEGDRDKGTSINYGFVGVDKVSNYNQFRRNMDSPLPPLIIG